MQQTLHNPDHCDTVTVNCLQREMALRYANRIAIVWIERKKYIRQNSTVFMLSLFKSKAEVKKLKFLMN